MKSTAKLMFGAALLTIFGTLSAQETTTQYNTAADWNKHSAVKDVDGVINVKGMVPLYSKAFAVDPSKKYTLKLSCRAQNRKNETDVSQMYAGFSVMDKNGRVFGSSNCNVVSGTLTEVAEDAAKGATVIMVKDGSKFRTKYAVLVSGAKADLSDLPNYNIIGNPKAVVRKGEVWEVTLQKPLLRDVKAGTSVREHHQGGYLYTAGYKKVGTEWITLAGSITGMKKGTWMHNVWPAGTAKAKIVILVNWQRKPLDTQIKDVTLTVK